MNKFDLMSWQTIQSSGIPLSTVATPVAASSANFSAVTKSFGK